jgi:DNA-binding transcriptional LysR family regulator
VEILSGNRAFDLMRGEADLAVRIRPTTEPDLVTRKIGVAGWALYGTQPYVARRGAPASAGDLRGHDVVAFDESLGAIPGALWLQKHGEGTSCVMRANSIVSAFNAVILGLGVSVLPCFMADPEPTLERLAPQVLGGRDIFVVVHPDMARVARVRAVMDFVVESFERDAALWSGEHA